MATNKPRPSAETVAAPYQDNGSEDVDQGDDSSGELLSQKKTPNKFKSVRREKLRKPVSEMAHSAKAPQPEQPVGGAWPQRQRRERETHAASLPQTISD